MRAATVVQVLHDLFYVLLYVLLHVLFYLCCVRSFKTDLSLSSNVCSWLNQSAKWRSGRMWYMEAADWNNLICVSTSNSRRLLSKLMRPLSVVSRKAASIIIRSVRNVPRYGTVPWTGGAHAYNNTRNNNKIKLTVTEKYYSKRRELAACESECLRCVLQWCILVTFFVFKQIAFLLLLRY